MMLVKPKQSDLDHAVGTGRVFRASQLQLSGNGIEALLYLCVGLQDFSYRQPSICAVARWCFNREGREG